MPFHTPEDERLARDPMTAPQVLERLAANHPELRPMIADNPAAPAALRAKILATTRPAPRPGGGRADEMPTVVFRHGAVAPTPRPQEQQPTAGDTVLMPAASVRSPRDRRTMMILLGCAAFVVLAGIIGSLALVLGQPPNFAGQPRESTTDTSTASASASPSASATTTEPAANLDQLGASGCSAATKDAQLLVDYGKENSSDSTWKTKDAEAKVVKAMENLKRKCQDSYATQVAETAKASGATAALAGTLDKVSKKQVRPAPQGALAHQQIVSPSKNITCQLFDDRVACNVRNRDYQECPGAEAFTVSVDQQGKGATCSAGVDSADGAQTLAYGQSTAHGEFACTSESSGMTCWNTVSGKGFSISKERWSQF